MLLRFEVGVTVLRTRQSAGLTAALSDAAIWGLTMVLFHEYLQISEDTAVERNRFYFDRNLATPAHQAAGPNVETLYGFAWIDLANGPQVLEVPDTADRYYCLQFMDVLLQTIGYVGRRATGTTAGTFLLAGPGWAGETPIGMTRVELPTDLIFVLARMQVGDTQDPAEPAEASRLLGGLALGVLSAYPHGRIASIGEDDATGTRFPIIDVDAMGARYFDRLCELLATQPLPPDERGYLQRFARIGIGPGQRPSADRALEPLLNSALTDALAEIRSAQPWTRLGEGSWTTSTPMRDVGALSPKLRASMNIDVAPGFHAAVEAIYAWLVTAADGSALVGSKSYRVQFPPRAAPPVHAFWSMTVYAMPGMRLVANPSNRYAIGSNFEDLVYGADGGLDLVLQRDEPTGGPVNWLPTPSQEFMVMCRFYQPGTELIDGRYSLPPAVQEEQ